MKLPTKSHCHKYPLSKLTLFDGRVKKFDTMTRYWKKWKSKLCRF